MFDANVITVQGRDAIRKVLAGEGKITFTRAVGGSGVRDKSELSALTVFPQPEQELIIAGIFDGKSGPELLVRIASAGLRTAYALRQIGLYVKLDDNGEEILFQIVQDETGVNIPSESETVGVTLDMRIGIAVDFGEASALFDSSAYVTYGQLQAVLGDVPRVRDSVAFSIAPDAWNEIATVDATPIESGLSRRAVVSDPAFSTNCVPLVLFDMSSLSVTARCGVSAHCEMEDGALRLYAKEIPAETISGVCRTLILDRSALGALDDVTPRETNATWGAMFGL